MRTLAIAVFGLAACTTDSAQTRLSELVVTGPEGTKRLAIAYADGRVREVRATADGTPAGTIRFVYDDTRLVRLDVTDRDGDIATQTYSWTGEGVTQESFVAGHIYSRDRSIGYADGRISTEMFMLVHQDDPQSWSKTYRYDGSGRVDNVANTTSTYLQTTALTYGDDGLAHVSCFDDDATYEDLTFHYTSGQLAEISGSHNVAITYNSDGRIARIESEAETYEYSYGAGDVEGLSFSPDLPYGELFDLDGTSLGTLDVLHMPVPYPNDF